MVKQRADLKVINLFNKVSGVYVDAEFYLRQDERRVTRLRRWLTDYHKANKKYLVCSLCDGPVYLKGNSNFDSCQQLHFAHYQSGEYESCSLNDKNPSLTEDEIRAIKYNGVPESKRHIHLKNILGSIMKRDVDCKDVYVDECYKNREKWERRRPDVQCIYKNQNIVFEIQLSTEFVTIISEREKYYKEKNAFLIWVFDSKATSDIMNLSEKDIFYSNNLNAFCLDSESIGCSLQQNKLNLLVCYEYPEIDGEHIVSRTAHPKRITIDEVTFNKDSFSAYYFNYDKRFYEYRYILIYSKLEKLVKNIKHGDLARYISAISHISVEDESSLYKFILYMLSGKSGTDVLTKSNSDYISYCQGMFNPHGNAKIFAYFYTMVRCHGHKMPKGNAIKKIDQKVKDAFGDLRNKKCKSSYYPNLKRQEIFAFLFPKEYQCFLELIKWCEIPWEKVDIDKFKLYESY